MLSPLDFIQDLLNPDLQFLPKALAVAVMSSILCGVIGTYVVLRGMAFIGDAVAHSVFPGLAVAFVIQGNLVLGGAIAGTLTAIIIAVFSQNRRIKEDSVIGVFFVAAFALGIVIISQAPGYAGSLQQFLFGSITGIPTRDVITVAITGLVLLLITALFHRQIVAVTLDREMARSAGLPVFALDLGLYVMVAIVVVISVQTIGNILVLALLITPAAAARLLTDKLSKMMLFSALIGAGSAIVGLYLSWSFDLPTGGTIVLVATAVFLLAWILAPRHGLLLRRLRQRDRSQTTERRTGTPRAVSAAALLLSCALAGAGVLTQPAPAQATEGAAASQTAPGEATETEATKPQIISNVHTDTVSAKLVDNQLTLEAKYDTPEGEKGVWIDPRNTVFHLEDLPSARLTVPAADHFSFLGAPGETVWVAPQRQNYDLIWPGFSTEDAALVDAMRGGTLKIRLLGVDGPGRAEVFLTETFGPRRIFSSVDQLGDWTMGIPQHTHMNWAFGETGTYRFTFEAEAVINGQTQKAQNTYTFVVGELPDEEDGGEDAPGGTGDADGTGDGETDAGSDTPGKDQNPDANEETAAPNKPRDPATPPTASPKSPPTQGTKPKAPAKKPSQQAPRQNPRAAAQECVPPLVFDSGHIDLFNVSAANNRAVLQLKEDVTGLNVIREPESVLLRVKPSAYGPIPSGIGGAPARGYMLPLAQDPNLLWPGWNSLGFTEASGYTNVSIRIHSVNGPGSVILATQDPLGGWSPIMNRWAMPGTISMPTPAHTHAAWVFSHSGVYKLTVSATATNPANGRTLTTATRTYAFQVGDVPLGDVLCGVGVDPETAAIGQNVQAAVQEAAASAAAEEQRRAAAAQAEAEKKQKTSRAAKQADAKKLTPKKQKAGGASSVKSAFSDVFGVFDETANGSVSPAAVAAILGGGAVTFAGIVGLTVWYVRRLLRS